MFRKSNAKKIAPKQPIRNGNDRAEVNTVIGRTTTLEGNIHFAGVLKIDGVVKGNLEAEGEDSVLILNEEGRIQGEVHVPSMIINGKIDGNVHARNKIELYQRARVMGDVHYNLLEMEVGAEVNGRMIREEPVAAKLGDPKKELVIEDLDDLEQST